MTVLLHKELTGAIIGAYYEVYNHTSRTLPEYLYERAMIQELRSQGFSVTQQDEYQIVYKERLVGVQRLDLFILQEVVVENKVANRLIAVHKAQGLSYLKTVGKEVGLLFNFGNSKPEFDRLYFNQAERVPFEREKVVDLSAELLYPELTDTILGSIYEVFSIIGPGFVHRIYANACHHELKLRGMEAKPVKRMQVAYKGAVIGDIAFGHILVDGKIIVFPVALRDIKDIQLDDLKHWMQICGVQLGVLANFNATRLEVLFVRV